MLQQRWIRIIPAALITYTIAYIDRTNISMALPFMSRDLGMTPSEAGAAAGIFFWGYLLLQIPGGHIANQWSAKRFIGTLMAAWGIAAIGCGLVRTWHELWIMRLLLGISQGGIFSATLVLISRWFPRPERARANALWMICGPMALIISSPLSGWILDHWNWRVMVISEGALPFLWLLIWPFLLYDYPRQPRWLSAGERSYLESTLENEKKALEQPNPDSVLRAIARPQVLLLILIYFLRMSAEVGFLFWLPSALQKGNKFSSAGVGGLASIPFIVGILAMLINSWHSDKTGERRRHVYLPFAIGGVFLLIGLAVIPQWPMFGFALVCLTTIGTYGALGPFWAIPTETLPRNVAATAMGVITAIGSLGGFCGPVLIGYLNKTSGDFRSGFSVLGLALLVTSALCLLINRGRSPVPELGIPA